MPIHRQAPPQFQETRGQQRATALVNGTATALTSHLQKKLRKFPGKQPKETDQQVTNEKRLEKKKLAQQYGASTQQGLTAQANNLRGFQRVQNRQSSGIDAGLKWGGNAKPMRREPDRTQEAYNKRREAGVLQGADPVSQSGLGSGGHGSNNGGQGNQKRQHDSRQQDSLTLEQNFGKSWMPPSATTSYRTLGKYVPGSSSRSSGNGRPASEGAAVAAPKRSFSESMGSLLNVANTVMMAVQMFSMIKSMLPAPTPVSDSQSGQNYRDARMAN